MKTIEEWFKCLPENIAKKAIFNAEIQDSARLYRQTDFLSNALTIGFNWTDSAEGMSYWYNLFLDIDKQEQLFKTKEDIQYKF